jgi:hypothetical protein
VALSPIGGHIFAALVRFLDRTAPMRASLVLGLILTAGCLQTAGAPEIPLRDTEWVLSSLLGRPPLAQFRTTIQDRLERLTAHGRVLVFDRRE